VACIQETRWKGSGCKFYGAKGQRYKLFWMGGEERSDGVGIFVAEKWVDSVVNIERHSKRVLILRMVLDNGLLNIDDQDRYGWLNVFSCTNSPGYSRTKGRKTVVVYMALKP